MGTPEKIKVIAVDDDNDFTYLISKMITRDDRLEFSAAAANKADGVRLAQMLRPDIVLMDISLSDHGDWDGIDAAKEIRVKTDAKIILLTSFEQPEVIINASKKAFASGYVYKSNCKGLTDIIYDTAVSSTPQEQLIKELVLQELSAAEKGVLNMLINGGVTLRSANKTILNQRAILLKKLGIRNKDELIHIFRGGVQIVSTTSEL